MMRVHCWLLLRVVAWADIEKFACKIVRGTGGDSWQSFGRLLKCWKINLARRGLL
jgi:hypothetical protein